MTALDGKLAGDASTGMTALDGKLAGDASRKDWGYKCNCSIFW